MNKARQTIGFRDATEAGVVLECFLKDTELPVVDKEAVRRVYDALLAAILVSGEHSSVVLMSEQSE